MLTSLLNGHWLPFVSNIALQSLFVLAVAALVLVCTRKASAARRHLVAVAALGGLLLIPLIALVIPAPQPLLQVSGPGLTLRRSPFETISVSVPSHSAGVQGSGPGRASTPSRPVFPSPPAGGISTPATSDLAPPTAAPVSLARFAPWLAAFWLLGVLVVLGRLAVGWRRIRQIVRHSDAVLPESLQARIQALLSEVGFARPLRLVRASRRQPISVAMTWGIGKATLLLPADAAQWPEERLRVVLLHELAHIRRHDWLTQLLGQLVCALYWFHPFVWILNRHAQIEAERACDDAVLLSGVRAKAYATHLLDVVRAMQAGREAPTGVVAMARPMQVRYRLQSILNAQRNRQSPTRSVRTLVLVGTGLLLCAVSWLRPLAWANGHQQTTVSMQTAAIGPVVTLPNGISVELAAVGVKPAGYGENDLWTPDGKPILELPLAQTMPFASREYGYPDRLLRRALYFRLQADPRLGAGKAREFLEFSTTGYVVDPTQHLQTALYRHGRNVREEDYIMPPYTTAGTVLLGLPHTDTHCTYRLGIATGPWETIATTRLTPSPNTRMSQMRLVFDDSPRVEYIDSNVRRAALSLLGGQAPLGDVARRVIALDKDGKELNLGSVSSDEKRDSKEVPGWAPARIVEFRLQTRPYQWAEFKDILLVHTPAKKPSPISPPPPLTAYRHTFACGITLDVPAVTESRKEGGLWWQPDGKPLAGPLKGYEGFGEDLSGWQPRKRPRALALRLTSPHALSYTAAVRFVPSVPDEMDERLPADERQIDKNRQTSDRAIHDFPADLPQAKLRYGIATVRWRTVASIAMPTGVLHAGPTGDPNQGGVMMEVPGFPKAGDLPRLRYTTSTGKFCDLPFTIRDTGYLPDVARRFVAVDKAGHVFPLLSNNGSQEILDKNGKSILLDPTKSRESAFLPGDYLRREMDMVFLQFGNPRWMSNNDPGDLTQIREFRLEIRPYEWAELRNIALQPTKGAAAR